MKIKEVLYQTSQMKSQSPQPSWFHLSLHQIGRLGNNNSPAIFCLRQKLSPRQGNTSRIWFQGVNAGFWLIISICWDSRDLLIKDTLKPNVYLSSTLRPMICNAKVKRWFQSWGLAVLRITPRSMNLRFGSTSLFWFSSLTNFRTKVRVLIIWRIRIWGPVIWIHSTELVMFPEFYCGSQGAHHLGCSMDHCRVPSAHKLYQEPLQLL